MPVTTMRVSVMGSSPRVRGRLRGTPRRRGTPGSSPRVRGRLRQERSKGLVARLIPACAGQTVAVASSGMAIPAHPRVCGADVSGLLYETASLGSSPRVRGRLIGGKETDRPAGLIPACAGQTSTKQAPWCWGRAHPRVCGANGPGRAEYVTGAGSSPRVRGRLGTTHPPRQLLGLIPACAGQTQCRSRVAMATRAHPRVCGADLPNAISCTRQSGSSPRVRGRPTG